MSLELTRHELSSLGMAIAWTKKQIKERKGNMVGTVVDILYQEGADERIKEGLTSAYPKIYAELIRLTEEDFPFMKDKK